MSGSNVWIEINSLQHELRGLSFVGEGVDDGQFIWSDDSPGVEERLVWFAVLGEIVTSVEDAPDTAQVGLSVISEVLEILRHPASADQDGLRFLVVVEVSVEWSHDLDTLLSVVDFIDLDFLAVVEVSLEGDRLPSPFLLELVQVLVVPWEAASVLGSDVDCIFAECFGSK